MCALFMCAPAGATELSQLFKTLGAPMSYEKVADVFMRYDKDESGQIEFGEFLLMFQVRDVQCSSAWPMPASSGHIGDEDTSLPGAALATCAMLTAYTCQQ